MKIVITGASGNVGSALLHRLVAEDRHELVGISRRPPTGSAPFDQARWVGCDLTDEACRSRLKDAFDGADAVVHLAWGFQPSHDQDYLEELGLGGTRRVLEAVADAQVPHLVHMSSVGAYSPKEDDRPVDETWPTHGVPSSWYSRSKAAAERLLDAHERVHPDAVITRLRPGIIGQGSAGSALLRYALPAVVPAKVLDVIPVLPLDARLAIPMVHADDVAEAIARVLDRRAGGAFNLSAEPPITTKHIAAVLDARPVHVPAPVVRTAVSLSWHARLQQVDPGWVDMGFALPLLDTSRATRELDWAPEVDAYTVLSETLAGMRSSSADASPALRQRSVPGQLMRALRRGPIGRRQRP